MSHENQVRLLVKEHVRDPGSMETVYRGVGDYDKEVADGLLGSYPESVEEMNTESLASKNKAEVVEVAQAVGVEVDGSENKEELVKKVANNK